MEVSLRKVTDHRWVCVECVHENRQQGEGDQLGSTACLVFVDLSDTVEHE